MCFGSSKAPEKASAMETVNADMGEQIYGRSLALKGAAGQLATLDAAPQREKIANMVNFDGQYMRNQTGGSDALNYVSGGSGLAGVSTDFAGQLGTKLAAVRAGEDQRRFTADMNRANRDNGGLASLIDSNTAIASQHTQSLIEGAKQRADAGRDTMNAAIGATAALGNKWGEMGDDMKAYNNRGTLAAAKTGDKFTPQSGTDRFKHFWT
jgi:hypothetical protein